MSHLTNIEKKISKQIEGEVLFDAISRAIYSTDSSIYEVRPAGIVIPKSIDDIQTIVNIAKDENIPLIPRGAATGITGGCLGEGIILDLSKYLTRILLIDPLNKIAICEPGVIQDDLNAAAVPFGLRLGPDTSTGNRATIGGMLANNAAGAHSLLYGCMADHILEADLALASGNIESFGAMSIEEWKAKSTSDPIFSACWRLRESLGDEISKRFPNLPRRVSGYNFPSLLSKDNFNLCKLIAGSEGTLGITAQMTLKLSPIYHHPTLCLIRFESLSEAFHAASGLLESKPIALEIIDDKIMLAGRSSPAFREGIKWLETVPAALLVLEYEGNEAQGKALDTAAQYRGRSFILTEKNDMKQVWDLRKAGLGLLMSKRSYSRAIAFLEDISVHPAQLPHFMDEFINLLSIEGKSAGIYGHAGAGCMHIRPYMDIRSPEERKKMEALMHATAHLLIKYHGALSGEHGDGLIRSWLNETLFGPLIYRGFNDLKEAFDPHHLMNPNKIVGGPPLLENLKQSPNVKTETFLDFSRDGGVDLAVDMCNGNGLCRKREGVMCPSFQATKDEKDSTRGRANLLRNALVEGRFPGGLGSEEVKEILDLCLSCKACKTECPSQVDMAKLKAESLHQYYKKQWIPIRNKLFGNIGSIFSWAAKLPGISNYITSSFAGKKLMFLIGVSPSRTLPHLAKETFDQWVAKQVPEEENNPDVILFNDTFTNFVHPEVGKAAYLLLKKLGYKVKVPPWTCCGRTAMSKGLLSQARSKAKHLSSVLGPYLEIPIVFLEPSCWSITVDDFKDMGVDAVQNACLLEEFLLRNIDRIKKIYQPKGTTVAIHVHCHQKALQGVSKTYELFKKLLSEEPIIIESGCCGMAGSFGYEKEHEKISMQIAELSLFPSIRELPLTIPIIANGTSCRAQISEGLSRKVLHVAEYFENT